MHDTLPIAEFHANVTGGVPLEDVKRDLGV